MFKKEFVKCIEKSSGLQHRKWRKDGKDKRTWRRKRGIEERLYEVTMDEKEIIETIKQLQFMLALQSNPGKNIKKTRMRHV